MSENGIGKVETIARGICVRDGKVLLCRPKGGNYTYLPGGHIEIGETGRAALEREMLEETGQKVTVTSFRGVVENSFEQKGEMHSEINLVYSMELSGLDAEVESREDWIEFLWCRFTELKNMNLLPEKFILLENGEDFFFNV